MSPFFSPGKARGGVIAGLWRQRATQYGEERGHYKLWNGWRGAV